MKTTNLPRRIFALDYILEFAADIHQVGPYVVDIRMLQHQLYSILPVTFMDEFMDVLGLSKETSMRINNKIVDLTVSPIEKMKKSLADNLRIVKKKLEAGKQISGQNELGWFLVYKNILDNVEKQNIKNFVFNLIKNQRELDDIFLTLLHLLVWLFDCRNTRTCVKASYAV